MPHRSSLAVYGLVVIASGLWRYLGQPDGDKGLWFGVVVGAIALLGALRGGWIGWALGAVAVTLVGGWFSYEALVLRGYAAAELRQLIVLAVTVAQAVSLAVWARGLAVRRPRQRCDELGDGLG